MTQYIFFMIDGKYPSVMVYNEGESLDEYEKHIPKDLPYIIIDSSEIDLEFLQAYDADMSNPNGYGKGDVDYASIYKSIKI
jgi:hypothetical protein